MTMSLRGRYMIDRVKAAVSHRFKLPCPPYGMPSYWDGVYTKLGPEDVYEWGSTSLQDVMHHRYDAKLYADEVQQFGYNQIEALKLPPMGVEGGDGGGRVMVETTFGETIGVPPEGNAERKSKVLLLGCGNSKFGEDMLTIPGGWSSEEGESSRQHTTIIQADVSQRVISTMSHRCAKFLGEGSMEFVQDDATSLTAFEDGTIDAVVDKGMMDALFCASRPDILMQVMKSVNRALLPGGIYGFFSFSRPEFLLKQLLEPIDGEDDDSHDVLGFKKRRSRKDLNGNKTMWKDVQVRALENILFYRFQKADGEVDDLESNDSNDSRSARITRQKRQRMQRRKQ